jgi:cobalt-zinc-cadmium efflux system protein
MSHDHHQHGHGHHHHLPPDAGDRQVALAILVNFGLTVAQIVGGLMAGSLALIADAIHNLSDAISLVLAFAARKIARRPSDAQMTFGYARIEVVAALVNYTTLIVIGLYLAWEAVFRFFEPQPVTGWLIVVIAGVALVVDAVTALLTFRLSKESVNIRAAFLHNLADALGSVAVILAGTLILLFGWHFVDPLVTLGISAYILWQSFSEIGPVIRILVLGTPPDLAVGDVVARIRRIEGVSDLHQTRLWQVDEHNNALDTHLVIEAGAWSRADAIKDEVKALLARDFGIARSTLELECAQHVCDDPEPFGHTA